MCVFFFCKKKRKFSANFDQAFKKISDNFFRAEFENPFKKANPNEDVWEMYRRNELIPLKTENTILKLNENSNSENEPIDRKLNKNRKKRKEKIAKI